MYLFPRGYFTYLSFGEDIRRRGEGTFSLSCKPRKRKSPNKIEILNFICILETFLYRQKSSAKNLSELDFRSLINCNVRPVGQANSLRSNKACLVTVSLTFIAHSNRLGKEQSRALFEARSASCEAKECGLARYSHSI